MKVSIIVTPEDGDTFYGEATLSRKQSKPVREKATARSTEPQHVATAVNLSSPVRPFMKKHARNKGGAQKFTLLLAHIAKGDIKKEVAVSVIQKQWGKMKGILGEWNAAHATRAKDQEWVDSPKHGTYSLLSGWKGAINA